MTAGAGRLAADPPDLAVALAVDIIRQSDTAAGWNPATVSRGRHLDHAHRQT
jgi:hypothetical protein